MLDRVDDGAVLLLREDQHFARVRKLRLHHDEPVRRRERQLQRALDLPLEHRAVRKLHQKRMETVVQRHVLGERVDGHALAREHRVHPVDAIGERAQVRRCNAAFGGQPGGEPFERAAHLDRIVDLGLGERACGIAAAGDRLEQPFVLQSCQRRTDRRARDAEPIDDGELGDALARRQLAVENHLAQTEQRLDGLRDRRLRRIADRFVTRCHQLAARNGTIRCGGPSASTILSISRRAHIAPASMFRL